jgi:hypothetical protein
MRSLRPRRGKTDESRELDGMGREDFMVILSG